MELRAWLELCACLELRARLVRRWVACLELCTGLELRACLELRSWLELRAWLALRTCLELRAWHSSCGSTGGDGSLCVVVAAGLCRRLIVW